MKQRSVIEALGDAIKAAIGTDLGNRIYYHRPPHSAALPLCLFDIVGDTPEMCMASDSLDVDVQVYIYGKDDPDAILAMNDALYEYLHRDNLSIAGFENVKVVNTVGGIPEDDEEIFGVRSQYTIRGPESGDVS